MTDNGYPADEFDQPLDGPRGVHRAPRSWWSRWGAFVVVLVVAPVIAVGVVTWLSDWQPGPGTGLPSAEQTDEPPADEPDPGDGTGPSDPESDPSTTEPEQPEPETEAPPPPPEPDLTRPVVVLNATRVAGLAAGGAETLGAAGFTSTSTGNWQGAARETSVVLYALPEDEVTARAVADTLGIAAVEQADVDGVVAVLAQDFAS